MEILVSFCNLRSLPGRHALGLLNSNTMNFRMIKLPPEIPKSIGMMGLAQSSRHVFVGLQVSGGTKSAFSPPGLLVFDRKDFTLVNHYVFKEVRDIHSLCLSQDEHNLYVVSTGTDEVIILKLNGAAVLEERIFWRPEGQNYRQDINHINCIYEWEGDLVVSGFGEKSEKEEWNSARSGFISNISQNKIIVSGIEHPHSFVDLNGRLAYCESKKRQVCILNEECIANLSGYSRGLCYTDDKLFIGTSASRKFSKSTRKMNRPMGLGSDGGACTVSRFSTKDFKIEKTVSLKNYSEEIYDLLPVDGTGNWPVHRHHKFYTFEKSWNLQYNQALQELNETVSKSEKIVLVDDNIWDESLFDFHRLYFLQRGGSFYGLPETSELAIQELEMMKLEHGASFIAFGWPSFWWFDHYKNLYTYLRESNVCVLENERLVIFSLKQLVSDENKQTTIEKCIR